MKAWLRQMAFCFAAGSAGALVKSAVSWGAARGGVTVVVGLHGAAALQPSLLYSRIVWGGLWALLFLLPQLRRSILFGGVAAGVVVTLMQWVVLPLWWHTAIHFALVPLADALLLNLMWGLATAALLRWL